jgi:hypothetical protein
MTSTTLTSTTLTSTVSLLDGKLAQARPIIDHYVKDDAVEAVCITGSLTAGLGTPYSDLDVIAIVGEDYQRPTLGPTAHHGFTTQYGSGLDRVDVVFRSAAELAELATLGQPYVATLDSNPAILHGPVSLIEDAVRLKLGQVAKPSPRLCEARDALTVGEEHLRSFMIAVLATDVGAAWMDALGFIQLRDFDSLEVLSRSMLAAALDAACVAENDLYRGQKWIWNRACRVPALSPVRGWLRHLVLDQNAEGPRQPTGPAWGQRMLLSQKLMVSAILRQRYSGELPAILSAALAGHPRGLIRSPYWAIVQMTQSAIMTDRDERHYTVPDLAVACWAVADGTARKELVRCVRRIYPDAARAAIEATLDHLQELGAISHEDSWGELFGYDAR